MKDDSKPKIDMLDFNKTLKLGIRAAITQAWADTAKAQYEAARNGTITEEELLAELTHGKLPE